MDIPETDSEDELPPGWEERCTVDGLVFYAHHSDKSTQWFHPRTGKKKKVNREMPYGWERQIMDDGKVFFVDHVNHKTTYIDPRLAFTEEETKSPSEVRQRFDSNSTGFQVLHGRDLTGKVAIITGANCGIGFETARCLAFHGCTVILACRDLKKAEKAIDDIRSEKSSVDCRVMSVDLASLRSVQKFAVEFCSTFSACHILILNAAVFGLSYSHTVDQLETTFQVNHLSQFHLVLLLQTALVRGSPSRVVFLSSESHRFSSLTKDNLTEEFLSPASSTFFSSMMAYNNSKLCNVLMALELQNRYGDLGISSFAVHPGNLVSSSLSRNWWIYRLLYAVVRPFTKSLSQACASTIYCATSEDMSQCGGIYVNNCIPCPPSMAAMDPILANKLWVISLSILERLMGKTAFSIN